MFVVYDTKNKELPVGVFDKQKEVAEFIGIKTGSVSSMISKNILANGRYRIINFFEEGSKGRRTKNTIYLN